MKKKLINIAVFAASVSALISCSKKGSSPAAVTPVTTTSPYFMKATINGASFTSSYVLTDTASILRNILGYVSTSSAFPVIQLALTSTAIGTSPIDGFNALAQIDSSATNSPGASYGSITISAINDTAISGSFYFTCTDSTKVTNGSFYAKRAN